MAVTWTNSAGRSEARSEPFNGVKVFSATMFADRGRLGEKVSEWLAAHASYRITDMVVTQSSDASFHCIAICVFYWESK